MTAVLSKLQQPYLVNSRKLARVLSAGFGRNSQVDVRQNPTLQEGVGRLNQADVTGNSAAATDHAFPCTGDLR